MGFLSSVKNKLGIGGVKVVLEIPGQVEKSKNTLNGKVVMTTKSDQFIIDLTVKLIEKYTTGRGDEKSTKEFDMGVIKIPCNFDIKTGETKEVPFTTMEEGLYLKGVLDVTGNIKWEGTAKSQWGGSCLTFRLETDYASIDDLMSQIQETLDIYPVVGTTN